MSIITNSSLKNEVVSSELKVFKSRIGQEETAQNELMNLLHFVRTNSNCLKFDLYRSSFNLINRELENSIFMLKGNWRNSTSMDDYETNGVCHTFNQLKNNLFEEETYYFEVSTYNNMMDNEYADSIASCIKIDVNEKEQEKAKEKILMCIEKWKIMSGLLKCGLYQSIHKDSYSADKENFGSFFVEQVWENSRAFNKSEIHKFELNISESGTVEKTEIYIMNMKSVPIEPINQNAVLGDPELIMGLRKLNKDFGELCVNASAVPWGKNLLDQRTKVLIAVAIDISEQITGKPFENHVSMACKQGITREELEELLLFMSIYAGFNKAGVFYSELDRIFRKG